jgi:hypothetical protein
LYQRPALVQCPQQALWAKILTLKVLPEFFRPKYIGESAYTARFGILFINRLIETLALYQNLPLGQTIIAMRRFH